MTSSEQGELEVARITIILTFDEAADGAQAIRTEYSEGLTLIDALGMIAFAQATCLADYALNAEEDDPS